MKDWTIPLGAGGASALLLLLVAAGPGGVFFGILAPLPLFFAGLARGLGGVAVASGVVLAVGLLVGGVGTVIGSLVGLVMPVVVLVRQALLSRQAENGRVEWYPAGLLTGWLAIVGLALLAGTMLVTLGDQASLSATIEAELRRALDQMLAGTGPFDGAEMAARLAPWALGLGTAGWMIILAVTGVLAQGAAERFSLAVRPSPEFSGLRLPGWIAPALVVAVIGAYAAPGDIGFAARSVSIVLLLPFLIAGAAVIHRWARQRAATTLILVAFYAALVFIPWLAVLAAGLGLIDQMIGFRGHTDAGGEDREDE